MTMLEKLDYDNFLAEFETIAERERIQGPRTFEDCTYTPVSGFQLLPENMLSDLRKAGY